MTALDPCLACKGSGSQPLEGGFITCQRCKGDGTQIRADLELLARAMSLPSERD